jgi:hypothetical protein
MQLGSIHPRNQRMMCFCAFATGHIEYVCM